MAMAAVEMAAGAAVKVERAGVKAGEAPYSSSGRNCSTQGTSISCLCQSGSRRSSGRSRHTRAYRRTNMGKEAVTAAMAAAGRAGRAEVEARVEVRVAQRNVIQGFPPRLPLSLNPLQSSRHILSRSRTVLRSAPFPLALPIARSPCRTTC